MRILTIVIMVTGFLIAGSPASAQFREPYGANPDPITPHDPSPDPWNRGLSFPYPPERDEPPVADIVMPFPKAPDPWRQPSSADLWAPLEYRWQPRHGRRSERRWRRSRPRSGGDDDDDD